MKLLDGGRIALAVMNRGGAGGSRDSFRFTGFPDESFCPGRVVAPEFGRAGTTKIDIEPTCDGSV